MSAEDPEDDAEAPEGADRPPLGELAERVRARRTAVDETGSGEADRHFREEGFDEIDAEDLWSTLEASRAGPGDVVAGDEPDEYIVPKRSYCESCPREAFAEPPAVGCSHPGTTIVEFVDSDHLRVRNCPVVAERRALGEVDHERVTPGTFGSR